MRIVVDDEERSGRVESLRAITDPTERALCAIDALTHLRRESTVVLQVRNAAICKMHAEGRSYSDIAEALHMTRSRVAQIIQRQPVGES